MVVRTVGVLAGCGTGHASSPAASPSSGSVSPATYGRPVQGRLGHLVIGDSYVHDLASGEVAAAYRTSLNSGDTRADLTGVYREITVMLLPMTERASGRVGRMPPQIDVVVPAQARSLSRLGACTGC